MSSSPFFKGLKYFKSSLMNLLRTSPTFIKTYQKIFRCKLKGNKTGVKMNLWNFLLRTGTLLVVIPSIFVQPMINVALGEFIKRSTRT